MTARAQVGDVWECLEYGLLVLVVCPHEKRPSMSRCLVLHSADDVAGVAGQQSSYVIPSSTQAGDYEMWKRVLP